MTVSVYFIKAEAAVRFLFQNVILYLVSISSFMSMYCFLLS